MATAWLNTYLKEELIQLAASYGRHDGHARRTPSLDAQARMYVKKHRRIREPTRITDKYYWPGMLREITAYVRNCRTCLALRAIRYCSIPQGTTCRGGG